MLTVVRDVLAGRGHGNDRKRWLALRDPRLHARDSTALTFTWCARSSATRRSTTERYAHVMVQPQRLALAKLATCTTIYTEICTDKANGARRRR
jgi:hypothetical protein